MARRNKLKRTHAKAHEGGHAVERKRGDLRILALPVAVASLFALIIAVLFLAGLAVGGPAAGPRAAIVDQLGLAEPNPSFVEAATRTLEQAGYSVDYYASEEVTIDLYRDLPKHGYDYVILRVHSGPLRQVDRTFTNQLFLFSSEPYSRGMYIDPQLADHLGAGRYEEEGQEYLGIGPEFIESAMRGSFDGATVILMGCWGLMLDTAAQAFLQRGAGAVVSWDGEVSAAHTDAATERLLQHMVLEGLTPQEAVKRTVAEVGPDPSFGAELQILIDEG